MILKFNKFIEFIFERQKIKLSIKNDVMLIDTKRQIIDMLDITNRRFMYHPKSGELILGVQYKDEIWSTSHAGEHGDSGSRQPFDEFVRGWVGCSGVYNNGIIHFAPPIHTEFINQFEDGYSTIKMFLNNGANGETKIRGFGTQSEFKIKKIFKVKKEEPVLV